MSSTLEPLIRRKSSFFSTRSGNTDGDEGDLDNDANNDETTNESTKNEARKVLATRPNGVRGKGSITSSSDKEMVLKAQIQGRLLFPWMTRYRIWWFITALGALLTLFFAPFQVAFGDDDNNNSGTGTAAFEFVLQSIFTLDILVNFNLAFYKDEIIVFDRIAIFKEYMSRMFWVDLIGVFPFENLATLVFTDGNNISIKNTAAELIALLRLLRLVRLYRLKRLSDILQYNASISLLWFTLWRDILVVLAVTHLEACAMYYCARLHNFDKDTTWLGPVLEQYGEMNCLQRYVTALYWCIVTFCTVGYGDFSPVSTAEQIIGCIAMLVNIVVAAWIIGSITLLMLKGDEKTGEYRDSLETLRDYSHMHDFEQSFEKKLRTQLRLEFNNREIADEQVLKNFPSAMRRKILRRLYLPWLRKTDLMKNVRQQFVDAFLASCTVEIFSPGEEIVERGSILSDLFLLVGGIAEVNTPDFGVSYGDQTSAASRSEHSSVVLDEHVKHRQLEAGDFIGDVGFFTESPQPDSVTCLTVCKTLTMSRSAYTLLAQDHPGSVGKILHNLLGKVEEKQQILPKKLSILRAGSVFDIESGYGSTHSSTNNVEDVYMEEIERKQEALTAIKDLVKMHMEKQKDDQTTRLLFAASRGDTATISLMCDQGFDPDNADYDSRTALMVASMKGNTDVVKLLLEYKADPNLADMHGSTALLEAVKNGHENTTKVLFEYAAELCIPDSLAASVLCQAVFDGDILLLKRLLRAGIQVNAADYDKRTAAHIAAAEGNVAAIRTLAEHGADLTLEDRWKNTVVDEAKRSNARQLLAYLKSRN